MSNPMCLAGSSEQPQCAAERFKATIAELTRELAAQTVRADENERDARRYRWLRSQLPGKVDAWNLTRLAAGLSAGDDEIDAALKDRP